MQILLAIFAIYSIALTPIFVALLLVQHTTATTGLSIQHTPVEHTIAGSRVEIQAVVEGGTGDPNATLRYRLGPSNEWKVVQMLPTVRGGKTYVSEIPKAELTESLYSLYSVDYQICVKDESNADLCTQVYTIKIGDFYFYAGLPTILYPNQTFSMDILVVSQNGFGRPIDLSIDGVSTQKITATFEPSPVTPIPSGVKIVKLNFSIQDSAPAGEYYLTVTGKSGTITRFFSWTLEIPDFNFAIAPASATLKPGDRASFNITLSSMYHFDRDVRIYVKGLPNGASYELTAPQLHLNGSSILALSIDTTSYVERGTYLIALSAIGGGRLNEFTITLIIT